MIIWIEIKEGVGAPVYVPVCVCVCVCRSKYDRYPKLSPSYFHSICRYEHQATVLDASLDKGRGVMADVLVQWGLLSVGDAVVIGTSFGRVKAMTDHKVSW